MILPLATETRNAAEISIGEVSATTRSQGTFSVDGTTPLYIQPSPTSPAIIQRAGTPLVATADAQANTPPPLPPNGTPAPVTPVSISLTAQAPEEISPVTLIIGVAVLWFIFFIL